MAVVRVKICGITRPQDARAAVICGAWAVGFIFYRKSPRFITPQKAKRIIRDLPPFITPVGVFVNTSPKEVRRVASICSLRTLQFHGDETPAYCRRFLKDCKVIKAFRLTDKIDLKRIQEYDVSAILMDTYKAGIYGGTGTSFPWSLFERMKRIKQPIILSGGLKLSNVRQAINKLQPFGVDISSGVEKSPGIKDHIKLKDFIRIVCKS